MIPWDPDEFYGVGPDQQEFCAIPNCNRPNKQRGLCDTCYHAWARFGMEGLRRRHRRINHLDPTRIRVPTNVEEALLLLTDAYERRMELSDNDPLYEEQTDTILKVCSAIGNIERRRKNVLYTNRYLARFVEQHGEAVLKQRIAEGSRAYRKRKADLGLIRVQVVAEGKVKNYWIHQAFLIFEQRGKIRKWWVREDAPTSDLRRLASDSKVIIQRLRKASLPLKGTGNGDRADRSVGGNQVVHREVREAEEPRDRRGGGQAGQHGEVPAQGPGRLQRAPEVGRQARPQEGGGEGHLPLPQAGERRGQDHRHQAHGEAARAAQGGGLGSCDAVTPRPTTA